jgi:predicted methyltransferase
MRRISLALAVTAAGCQTASPASSTSTAAEHGHGHGHGHGGEHGGGHGHGPGHFSDPSKYVPAWNSPERDTWQKPDEIVAALGIAPGATVVDLGTGTGYLLPALSKAVGPDGRVVAQDLEPAMLTFIEESAAREGWKNVVTAQGAVDDPRLASGSVDAIVTLNVWHHIENRGAYAARLREALKPGGSFVVVDFLKEQTEGFGPPLAMRLSADEVSADLVAGGFVVDVVAETMPRHYVVRGRRAP